MSLILPASLIAAACSTQDAATTDEASSDPGTAVAVAEEGTGVHVNTITEAPTGFDHHTDVTGATDLDMPGTNGFSTQAAMDTAAAVFANEVEQIADGVGPVFNAQSCRECHQSPVVGGASQVSELRAGHFNGTSFVDAAGGSLINDRAIDPSIQEKIPAGNEVRTFRMSLSLMGDGFVESIDSNTLLAISNGQPAAQRGTLIQVPVLESGNAIRAGRFGWKNQNSSLLSFAADAYVNEMGITSPLISTENTSNGTSVASFDTVADPEDVGSADITSFTLFMRSLKAPPVDAARAATTSAKNGSNLFNSTGCAVCHVRTITTAPAGTVINQGAFTVPTTLGDKNIHPLGDYLLHDIGTGDGIVQNGGQSTRNQVRTAPLWGLRARVRLLHDGSALTVSDAIQRHHNQAQTMLNNFNALTSSQQTDVLNFLNSL